MKVQYFTESLKNILEKNNIKLDFECYMIMFQSSIIEHYCKSFQSFK